ncbi:hypothetical protein ACOSQ2_019494 [Xanthoceras sorbifolium]
MICESSALDLRTIANPANQPGYTMVHDPGIGKARASLLDLDLDLELVSTSRILNSLFKGHAYGVMGGIGFHENEVMRSSEN